MIWKECFREEVAVLDEGERVLQREKLLFEGIERERILRAWEGLFERIERKSFESVRGAIWRDWEREFYRERRLPLWMREREFYSVRSCFLKGSRERVLRSWEGLLEKIKKKSFESLRKAVWRDWEREFWEGERGCLKGSRYEVLQREEIVVLNEGERVLQHEKLMFKGIKRESFESMRWAIKGDKKKSVLRAWEWLFEGIERKICESVRRTIWRNRKRVLRVWERLFEGIEKEKFWELKKGCLKASM